MKKFLLLMLVIFIGLEGCASEICQTGYDLTSGWNRFASRISGSNFIHKTILESYLEKQILNYVDGKVNINIDSFSTSDLKDGKFKSLSATGENIVFRDISASKITLNSICEFNQLAKTGNSTYKFVTDFPANATLELSKEDLNRLTNTTDFKKTIKNINKNLLGFMRIESLNFDISNNKLWYDFKFSTPFSPKKQSAKIGTSLYLNGNDVTVNTTDAQGKSTILSILNMTDALNYVNPLDFSSKILENSIINAKINEILIVNDKIILKAFVNIRK